MLLVHDNITRELHTRESQVNSCSHWKYAKDNRETDLHTKNFKPNKYEYTTKHNYIHASTRTHTCTHTNSLINKNSCL